MYDFTENIQKLTKTIQTKLDEESLEPLGRFEILWSQIVLYCERLFSKERNFTRDKVNELKSRIDNLPDSDSKYQTIRDNLLAISLCPIESAKDILALASVFIEHEEKTALQNAKNKAIDQTGKQCQHSKPSPRR